MSASAFFYVDGIPLKGRWIDIDSDTDWEDITERLAQGGFVPRDEDGDPDYGGDILVADAEGLAKPFTSTCDVFDLDTFREAAELVGDGNDESAVIAYIDTVGVHYFQADQFQDSYQGAYDSFTALAEDILDSSGTLDSIPQDLRHYFDYEKYGQDLQLGGDYCESNGHYFRNC